MSQKNINNEIDHLVDNFASELKLKLKSLVLDSEKQIIRDYKARHKNTKENSHKKNKEKSKTTKNNYDKPNSSPKNKKQIPRREKEYIYHSDSGRSSDSD
jgi:hypothetical protein